MNDILKKWAYIRGFDVDDIQHDSSECKHAIDELYDEAASLQQRVEALGELLRTSQALWAFPIPKGDYGWTVSAEYANLRQAWANAVVDATLREAGYVPDEVAERMAATARKAIAEIRPSPPPK